MPLLPKTDLQDYGNMFLRRKWFVVFTFVFILLAASIYCVVAPQRFKSSTTILVIPQSVPEDYVRSTISVDVNQQLATIKQQVLSRTTLTKVMDEMGLFQEERRKLTPEEVIEQMRERIQIDVFQTKGRDARLESFSLSFQHESREQAMRGTSRLATSFIEENLKTREQQAVGTSEFLDTQLKHTKDRLEVQEAKVKDYKMRFMGELPEQMDANLRMLTGLQDRLRANDTATRTAEDRKAMFEAQLQLIEKSIAAAGTENGAQLSALSEDPALSLPRQLAQKKTTLAGLAVRYTPEHPDILAAREEIASLEKRIAKEQQTASASADGKPKADPLAVASLSPRVSEEYRRMKGQFNSASVELASLREEKAAIRNSIASVEQKIQASPRREQEMISLVRDYENQKQSYDDLLKKKLEANISEDLEKRQKGTQFQILDPANFPDAPFTPNRATVMGVAMALALVLSIGGTIASESFDLRLRSVRDFRHLYKVPVLGYIPECKDHRAERAQAVRRAVVYGGMIAASLTCTVILLVYREQIRTILNL